MSYYVREVLVLDHQKTIQMYNVMEKGSELTVYTTADETKSRSMCRSLNLGAGFNGNTPPFFCAVFPKAQ